jgi:hypothetical protein
MGYNILYTKKTLKTLYTHTHTKKLSVLLNELSTVSGYIINIKKSVVADAGGSRLLSWLLRRQRSGGPLLKVSPGK